MDMKKMLTILSESKQVNECGDMGQSMPSTPPVSMSVNLNAQGIDQIKDLLNLMNKAEGALAPGLVGQGPAPMAMPMPEPKPMPMALPIGMDKPEEPKEPDMKDLIKIASDAGPEKSGEEPAGKKEMQDVANDVKGLADELKNSPAGTGMNEPTYGDLDAAIPSGDDLHKQKGTYPKVAGGDNPMQRMEGIKSSLSSLYKQIKETR